MATTTKPTAWGSTHLYLGEVSTTGVFPQWDTTEDIGIILSDSLTVEVTDGDDTELKDVNGVLVDELRKEPTYTLNFKIIKPADDRYTKFWDTFATTVPITVPTSAVSTTDSSVEPGTVVDGSTTPEEDSSTAAEPTTANVVAIKSFVSTKTYAILMANINSVGSDFIAIGKCSFTAKLTWSASEGYGVECTAKALRGYKNSTICIGPLTEDGATVLKKISDSEDE